MIKDAKYLLTETDPAKVPPCAAELAFVGRSNVGKSSLLNAVMGHNLARVSQTPGRTRTINVYQVSFARWLVDLPGYGFARGPERERRAWRDMIEGYLTSRESLRGVVSLVDAEVGPTDLDLQMMEWLESQSIPFMTVATKADKVKASRLFAQKKEVAEAVGVAPDALIWVSAAKGTGIGPLRDSLLNILNKK